MIKVLLVDDEPEVLEITRFRLEKRGYQVCAAVNGSEAFAEIAVSRPDVVVVDIGLPGISGLTFCSMLKTMANYRHIPVIVITGAVSEYSSEDAQHHHANGFLTKPYSLDQLQNMIQKLVLGYAKAPVRSAKASSRKKFSPK